MTTEEFEDIVDRLLEVGVPPTALSKAFGVDVLDIKERLNGLRVQRYGTAELSEGLAGMQWEALEEMKAMIHQAPYDVRARFIMAINSKTMSLTARQNPETLGNMRQDLLDLYQQATAADDPLDREDTSAFVAVAASDADQDEGPDG